MSGLGIREEELKVVVNHEEQQSVWPVDRTPLGLRKRMESTE